MISVTAKAGEATDNTAATTAACTSLKQDFTTKPLAICLGRYRPLTFGAVLSDGRTAQIIPENNAGAHH
jgi:hypothetical protein